MRCYICNSILQPEEVKFNTDCAEWEPCNVCLSEIREVFDDHIGEDELVLKEVDENEDAAS